MGDPELPDTNTLITQDRVDFLQDAYANHAWIEQGNLNPSASYEVESSTFIFNPNSGEDLSYELKGVNKLSTTDLRDEPRIFMASVSKMAIMAEFKEHFAEVATIPANLPIVFEIMERGQYSRLKEHPAYKQVLDDNDLIVIDRLLEGKMFPEDVEATVDKLKKDLIIKHGRDFRFDLPVDEVVYLSLVLSCNRPVAWAKNLLMNKLGVEEIGLYKYMRNKVKGYGMTISTENDYHWIQSDANVGLISEFAKLQHSLVVDVDPTGIVMENNPVDFQFDLTNSDFGKAWIAAGGKIVEKTGLMPSINYVEALARRYPMHMAMLSVVTLIPSKEMDMKPITFSHNKIIEVAAPDSSMFFTETLKDGDDNVLATIDFPATEFIDDESVHYSAEARDYALRYEKYVIAIQARFNGQFRTTLESIAKSLIAA